MSAVGLAGVLLALLAFPFSSIEKSGRRNILFFLACALHLLVTFVYYRFAQTTSADTVLYYFDPYHMVELDVRPGTLFLVYFVQTLKGAIGGTYLDYFIVFQAIGFWGVVFLMRTVEEIYAEMGMEQPRIAYIVLFLPGIYFWTSAIGKDAPLFLGCSLAVWAGMHLRRRFIVFAFAVLVMMLFRPHIALAALIALAAAAFFDARAHGLTRVALFGLALAGAAVVAGTVQSALQVNVASAESVGEFFSRQAEVTQRVGGTTAVVGASYPVKLFSLLFRPFFVDASGIFGLVASVENIFILIMVGTIATRFRDTWRLARGVFFLRFGLFFAGILTLLLAAVYYNVGLGLRQKMMIMPGLISFFAALIAVRRMKAAAPALSYA